MIPGLALDEVRRSRDCVAKRVLEEEERAVFTHCYCHSLNLAANDC